ncbi:hypothetical protein FKM82_028874 [Ascaphus truei]
MAEHGVHNYDDVSKMLSDLNKDLEKMLEEMEKISDIMLLLSSHTDIDKLLPGVQHIIHSLFAGYHVQATWMAYDLVVIRTNPALANSMKRLEDAFFKCKEEVERNWQDMLDETKQDQ